MKNRIQDRIVAIFIILLFLTQPALAIYGIFKFIPIPPNDEWKLCLCILVLTCSIFVVFKSFKTAKPVISHDVDLIIEWIGFTGVLIFSTIDQYLKNWKKKKNLESKGAQ